MNKKWDKKALQKQLLLNMVEKLLLAGRWIKFLSGKARENSLVLWTNVTREGILCKMYDIAFSFSQKPGGCALKQCNKISIPSLYLFTSLAVILKKILSDRSCLSTQLLLESFHYLKLVIKSFITMIKFNLLKLFALLYVFLIKIYTSE